MKKECFKCKVVKNLDDFYKHKNMKDGHLNKCKECSKHDVSLNRVKNIEYYREYDIKRGNRQSFNYMKEYREMFPNKYKAHNRLNNAIRSKNIFSEPCEICGEINTHGHHDDYLKPLNVRWLCPVHHSLWHKENGEGLNP